MYNAVILAGGKTPWLQKAVGTNIRALAPLGGRRMVEYIIDALDQSGQIGRSAADGPGAAAVRVDEHFALGPGRGAGRLHDGGDGVGRALLPREQLQLQLHYCLQTVKFYLFVTIYLC